MKKLIIGLTLMMLAGLVLFGAVPGENKKAEHGPGFQHYIAAQEALAADDLAGAQKALATLAAVCKHNVKEEVEAAAKEKDIQKVRSTFKKISAIVASKGTPEGYGVAFCPMADNNTGAYWVQKKGTILNPYFGSAMLHCGAFKEFKKEK